MLSMLRLLLAAPIMYLIMVNGPLLWLLVLFLLALASDYFDGRLARWSHSVSDWGKVLDPLADKISALMVILALVLRGSLPMWFLGLMLVRDTLIVSASSRRTQSGGTHSWKAQHRKCSSRVATRRASGSWGAPGATALSTSTPTNASSASSCPSRSRAPRLASFTAISRSPESMFEPQKHKRHNLALV
jgi:hypothetical protein